MWRIPVFSWIMTENRERALKRIQTISQLMDSQFVIPGTSIRFGLDPILGLIPFAGSLIGYFIGAYLVIEMYRNGASGKLAIKMIGNVILDAILGSIPYIGIIPDVWYKANNRNLKLLTEHYQEGKHAGSGIGIIIAILVITFLLIALLLYGAISLISFLLSEIGAISS